MLSKYRSSYNIFMEKLFGPLGRWIKPDFLSLMNLVFGVTAGYFLYLENYLMGLVFVMLSGLLDGMDGAIARANNIKTEFGAVLDSAFDRLSEGFILFGLSFKYPIAFLAMLFSFSVSYIMAKEPRASKGFAERAERLIILSLGLLTGQVFWSLVLLTVTTALTLVTRLLSAKKLLSN